MEDRLAQFLKLEELTAVKFAEIMEVQPSSISHLLSGRNRPNFEFISRMLLRFPNLNPDWIINGVGGIYKSEAHSPTPIVTDVKIGDVTDVNTSDSTASILDLQPDTTAIINDNTIDINMLELAELPVTDVTTSAARPIPTPAISSLNDSSKTISQVILFYSDGSFKEYSN